MKRQTPILRLRGIPGCVRLLPLLGAAVCLAGLLLPGRAALQVDRGALTNPPSRTAPLRKASSPIPTAKRQPDEAAPARAAGPRDEALAELVRRVLQDDPSTRSFASQATVDGRTVTLRGQTYHPKAKDLAERAVGRIPGVLAVRNLIQTQANADLDIAEKLRALIFQEPDLDGSAIGVTVINRKVFLSGTTESSEEAARVEQLALSVPGVRSVSNGLKASRSAPARRAAAFPARRPSYSVYRGRAR